MTAIALSSARRRPTKNRRDALRPDTSSTRTSGAGVKKNRTYWTAFFLMPVSTLAPILAAPASAEEIVERGPSGPIRIQLDAMPVAAMVTMLMRDVMRVPYVIADEVLSDRRMVSVNLVMPRSEIPVRVVRFLRSQGLNVAIDGGTVLISRPGGSAAGGGGGASASQSPAYSGGWNGGGATVPTITPAGSPLAPSPAGQGGNIPPGSYSGARSMQIAPAGMMAMAVVRPSARSVAELSQVLESVMPELVIAARGETHPKDDHTALVDQLEPDALVFSGEPAALRRAVALLRLLDRPKPVVDIRAVIVETRTTASSATALSVLASVGALRVDRGSSVPTGSDSVGIVAGGIRAFLSATKGDGRFRIVAEPKISVISGAVATLQSGAQVPTLGGVTVPENGPAVRSIEYRDSGVTLSVRPVVRASGIEMQVVQERSSVARTSTGVDDTPTVNRSAARSTVVVQPGETLAIAGLKNDEESHSRSGFFGGLLGGRERANAKGELVVMLEATLRDAPPASLLTVDFLGLPAPMRATATTSKEEN